VCGRLFLGRVCQLGEKRVGDVRQHQADGLTAAFAQAPGQTVAPVVQRLDRQVDTLRGFRRQADASVQIARHRSLGKTCMVGNILERYGSGHGGRLCGLKNEVLK